MKISLSCTLQAFVFIFKTSTSESVMQILNSETSINSCKVKYINYTFKIAGSWNIMKWLSCCFFSFYFKYVNSLTDSPRAQFFSCLCDSYHVPNVLQTSGFLAGQVTMVCLSVILDSLMSFMSSKFCRKLFLRHPSQMPNFTSSPSLKIILKTDCKGFSENYKTCKY